MTRRGTKLWIVAVTCLGLLIGSILLVQVFRSRVAFKMDSPRIFRVHGPADMAIATFIRHGCLHADRISFLVASAAPDAEQIWVGTVDAEDTLFFNEAIASADGTLFAVRSTCYGLNTLPPPGSTHLFTHAYDFKTGDRLVPVEDIFDTSPEEWRNRSATIEELLAKRGGSVSLASSGDLSSGFRDLSQSEWRFWKKWAK